MDLIEVIAPIIFVLIFGLGKVFEKLQEQGSKGSQKPRKTVDGEESSGGQDIWEAVRRRIEERTVIESEKPLPPVWLEEDPEPEVQPSAPPPPPPALVRKKPTKPVGLPTSLPRSLVRAYVINWNSRIQQAYDELSFIEKSLVLLLPCVEQGSKRSNLLR